MAEPVFLLFLGFPGDIETAPRDPRSKRRPTRKVSFSDRTYNGTAPDTRGWVRGEPRALTSQTRVDRDSGKTVTLFDADAFAAHVVADFGEDASGWAHLDATSRKLFGFRAIADRKAFDTARRRFDKMVAEDAA